MWYEIIASGVVTDGAGWLVNYGRARAQSRTFLLLWFSYLTFTMSVSTSAAEGWLCVVHCVLRFFFFFCLAVKGYLQLISNLSNKTECIKKKNLTYNLLFRYCHNRAFFFQMKSQCAKRQTNSMHCNKEIKREWQWAAGEWEKSVLDSHQRYFKRPPCQNTPQMKSH